MRLTVIYDASCAFCVNAATWLSAQEAFIPIELVSAQSEEAQLRFGILPWLGDQLVVVSDDGRVWAGSAAFIMCLWALVDYREWALRLSAPELAGLSAAFFRWFSARRKSMSALWPHAPCGTGACSAKLGSAYR
ncbi:MAG: DCC1-like thiol-disulfide oxidoreductase family protein [Polyangiaceae bacterium]